MYLGKIPVGASFTTRVTWTPAPTSADPSDSLLTLVHETEGDIAGPFDADPDGANTWKVQTSLTKPGRWRVRWVTVPTGGATNDVLYVE